MKEANRIFNNIPYEGKMESPELVIAHYSASQSALQYAIAHKLDEINKTIMSRHANQMAVSTENSAILFSKLDEISNKLPEQPKAFDKDDWQPHWKSPKGQPYFDSVIESNYTDHNLICSICGAVIPPVPKSKQHGT